MDLPCLDGLEDWERRKIMTVLQRDIELQKQKSLQLQRLKEEIRSLSEPLDKADAEKCCNRCQAPFGLLVNSGAPCPKCRARVCVACRVQSGTCRIGWLCVLCEKVRQYAVLTGEWINPDTGNAKQVDNNVNSELCDRKSHTENDYFPASGKGASETSVSGVLLRHLRQQSSQSRAYLEAERRISRQKSCDDQRNLDVAADFRSRSPSVTAIPTRQCPNARSIAGTKNSFQITKNASVDSRRSLSFNNEFALDTGNNNIPMLRVHPVEEASDTSAKVKLSLKGSNVQQSQLNVFHGGLRCPSVPNQMDRDNANGDYPRNSLLSVHNVRISIRSNSTDNVSTAIVNSRESVNMNNLRHNMQQSENDIRMSARNIETIRANQGDGKRGSITIDSDCSRPVSQNSTPYSNDIFGRQDDNVSLSDESVSSFVSLGSSVSKRTVRTTHNLSGSKIVIQGEILISCNYNCVEGSLEICIIKCRDLFAMNAKKNRSNPYVKLCLLPDLFPLGKRKTRVMRRTVNPEYNEVFKFTGLTKSEVETRTLLVSVWHCDALGRSHFLGEVRLHLADYPWVPDEMYWITLGPHVPDIQSEKKVAHADMAINIKFNCVNARKSILTTGSLQCLVQCPRNLPSGRASVGTPLYIKSYLYPDRNKVTKQKSAIMKVGVDPKWSHTFIYDDVTLEELRERCLELTVWTHHRVGANEFLGGIRLNLGIGCSEGQKVDWMDSNELESNIWKQMLAKPNTSVDSIIPLRLDMESKL